MKLLRRIYHAIARITPKELKHTLKKIIIRICGIDRIEKEVSTLRLEVKRLQGLVYLNDILKEKTKDEIKK